MKFLNYLIEDAPKEAKTAIVSGFSGGFLGFYNFVTDDRVLKFVSALATFGALVTMVLAWTFWILKIRKEGRRNGNS